MVRNGKLTFKNNDTCNARELAVSPSLPNMTATIGSSVVHYKPVWNYTEFLFISYQLNRWYFILFGIQYFNIYQLQDELESPLAPDSPSSFNNYMANHNLKVRLTLYF